MPSQINPWPINWKEPCLIPPKWENLAGFVMQQIPKVTKYRLYGPIEIVRHFLKDIEDGRYDGFPQLGVYTEMLENPTSKDYFKLDKDEGGILVVKILYGSPFEKVLKKYDIITAIDGHKIENDGTVKFRENQYTHFKYYIDKHQFGDEVSLEVYRDGKKLNLKVKFPKKSTEQNFTLTKFEYDKMPTYYMIGGYVFVPLTENLLSSSRRPNLSLRYGATKFPTKDKQEIVLLLKVLASSLSRGDYALSFWKIDKVNGRAFKDFKEFYKIVEESKDKYIVLER